MKINSRKFSLSTLLVMIPILYFNSCTMGFIKHLSFVLPTVVLATAAWILLYAYEKRKLKLSGILTLVPMLAVIVFLLLLSLFGLGDNITTLKTSLNNDIFIMFFMLVFTAYSDIEYANDRAAIVAIWSLDTIVSSVYTVYRLDNDPFLSRYMSTGSFYEDADLADIGGIISFGGIYGLVLGSVALTAFICADKNKRASRVLVLVVYCTLIVKAQFMLSIILLFAGILYVVLTNYYKKQNSVKRAAAVVAVIMVAAALPLLLPSLFKLIIDTGFFGEAVNQRLEEMRLLFLGGQLSAETDIMIRAEKYLTSITAFRKSFGMGALWNKSVTAGGHSEILDGFANYGILFVFFIFAVLCFGKYIRSKLSGKAAKIYRTVFNFYIIMSLLNTSAWAQTMLVLIVIIPFMCLNEVKTEEFCERTTKLENDNDDN